jgi:hypothetical protein
MPSTLFPQVLAEVIGTGGLTRRRWEDAVQTTKAPRSSLFDDRPTVTLRLRIDGAMQSWMHVRHAVKPLRDLPQFLAPTITARDRWQAAANDVLGLLLHAVAALTMALIAQRRAWQRYDFASASGPP